MPVSADPPEAPGRLALVEDFVNSAELPDGDDELADVDAAGAWLARHGVTGASLHESERRDLVELREALRDLLEGNSGSAVGQETVERVMHRVNAAGLAAVISPSGGTLVPRETGVGALVAELAAAIVTSTIDGTWRRLKICRNADCRWAFYDSSKNARRAWCSMRVCGCQSKSRAYRARKRETVAT